MKRLNISQWLFVVACSLLANVANAYIISQSGVSGLEVEGYGFYDLSIGDGIYSEVYSDHADWDTTYTAEANAVSAALLDAILAQGSIEFNYFDGCTHFEVCILTLPDTYDTHTLATGELVHDFEDIGAVGMGGPYSNTGWIAGGTQSGIRESLYPTYSSGPSNTLVTFHKVPEPSSLALLSLGVTALLWGRKKKCKKSTCISMGALSSY
mgnify:CR=1 FL=1